MRVPSSSRRYPILGAVCFLALAPVGHAQTDATPGRAQPDVPMIGLPDQDTPGSFEARFLGERGMPSFARPDIAALFATYPSLPVEEQAVAAAPDPAQPTPEQDVAGAEHKTPAQFVKELVISPAEGAPAHPPIVPDNQSVTAPPENPPTLVTAAPEPTAAPQATAAPRPREQALVKHDAAPVRNLGAGRAGFYQHAGRTANGERYNPDKLTAAHRSLPFGMRVRVVNRDNGRSVVVRINDRTRSGIPFLIDLSRGSARALGITAEAGVARVALYETK
jgi:rare lipoprotein A